MSMHAIRSIGGVLPDGEYQTQLHDRIVGVRYRTAEEKHAALDRIVKPFHSIQVERPKRAPSTTGVPPAQRVHTSSVRAVGSHKKSVGDRPMTAAAPIVSRPSSSTKKTSPTVRPSTAKSASSSTKKSAAASSSVDHTGVTNKPTVVATAPSWIASAVHPPNRPNAPSQMDEAKRAALHAVDVSKINKKSHKLLNHQYGKQFTAAAPKDLDEANTQVVIERHARPLVIHPKDHREEPVLKFVPIGHVVGVRPTPTPLQEKDVNRGDLTVLGSNKPSFTQSATPGQKEERHVHFTQPLPEFVEDENIVTPPSVPTMSLKAQAKQSFQAMQAEFRPHGLFSQVDRQRQMQERQQQLMEQQQQQQQHSPPTRFENEQEQKTSTFQQQPLSATASSLATPAVNAQVPQPYSAAFQQQSNQSQSGGSRSNSPKDRSAAAVATSDESLPPTSPPNLSIRAPTEASDTIHTVTVTDSNGRRVSPPKSSPTAADGLTSPSPVRSNGPPKPTSLQPSTPSASNQFSKDEPLSPLRNRANQVSLALAAEQDRRKQELEHEKQMKSYLSPSNRAAAHKGLLSPTKKGSTQFTPNPYAKGVDADEGQSKGKGLFYDPVVERPKDLPKQDIRAGLATVLPGQISSLYPSTDSDPLRALAASLRGPRLKYEPPVNAADASSSSSTFDPTSPRPLGSPSVRRNIFGEEEEDPSLPHVWLGKEIERRAEERAQLEKEQKAIWQAKWQRVRQSSQANVASARSGVLSPTAVKFTNPISSDHGDDAQKQLQFDFPEVKQQEQKSASPVQTQTQNAPATAPGIQVHNRLSNTSASSIVSGWRTSDPVVTTSHTQGARPSSRVSFVTDTSASSTASSLPHVRRIIVGSTNGTKVGAVRAVVDRVFASLHEDSWLTRSGRERSPSPTKDASSRDQPRRNEVIGVDVPSGVSAQPLSSEETKRGALARAKAALFADPLAEYGVGIEGGIERVGEQWFESGWCAVVDRSGRIGVGTSARYEISEAIAKELLTGRTELCHIADRLSGETGVRSKQGFMGVLTNSILPRQECYEQGVIFAFAPFISSPAYWQGATTEPGPPASPSDLKGGCLCGAVRYRVAGSDPSSSVVYCHCSICRKASGAPVVAWASFPQSRIYIERGTPASFHSSAKAMRQFCPSCGTQLFFSYLKGTPQLEVDVALGTLDDPAALKPDSHIFTNSRVPWFDTADSLPRHAEDGPWNTQKI